MEFGANKTPVEVIRERAFGGTFLETFILMLLKSGTKNHGKNPIS